jgi:hypothetical protein
VHTVRCKGEERRFHLQVLVLIQTRALALLLSGHQVLLHLDQLGGDGRGDDEGGQDKEEKMKRGEEDEEELISRCFQ